jgi:signal transduction histidine kinase
MTSAPATELTSECATENLLRTLAHEIRQPLSTIESIAYYLSLVPQDQDNHGEQLLRIQQLVEQSNWILSNAVGLANSRPPAPETLDINQLITQTIAARPASIDPPVQCELAAALPRVRLDPGYGRALIENALGLFRRLVTEAHPVLIQTSLGASGVEIDLFTGAPGYRSIGSLPSGSALSIDSARRIAVMHGGCFEYHIDPAGGIRVRVMLP